MQIINSTPKHNSLLSKTNVLRHPKNRHFIANAREIKIIRKIPPSGELPSVELYSQSVGDLDGIPLEKCVFGHIEALPKPADDIFYIVSELVAKAAKADGRTDCLISGGLVRDVDSSLVLGFLFLQII